MGLIQILTEASKKDIIVNKIGLSGKIADQLIRYYGKKRALLYANFIVKWKKQFIMPNGEEISDWGGSLLSTFDWFLKSNNKPKDLFDLVKKAKPEGGFKFSFNDLQMGLNDLKDMLINIRDYTETTGASISDMTIVVADREAREWHENKQSTGESIQLKEGQEIVHEFKDGYYWVDLGTANCSDEAESMGHCGNTSAETMLSLRDPDHVPHVTVAFDYDGTYYQMKGKGNKKPVEKYHKYCVWLFTDEADDHQITNYRSEYEGEDDFKITDYYEKDPELVNKILEENPDLEHISSNVKGFINKYISLDSIPNQDIKEYLTSFDDLIDENEIDGGWYNTQDVGLTELADYMKDLKSYFKILEQGYVDIESIESSSTDIEMMIQDIDYSDSGIMKAIIGLIETVIENEEIEIKTIASTIAEISSVAEGWEQFKDSASPSDWVKFLYMLYEKNENSEFNFYMNEIYRRGVEAASYDAVYNFVKENINPVFSYRGDLPIEEVLLTVKPENKSREYYQYKKHSLTDIDQTGAISVALKDLLVALLDTPESYSNDHIEDEISDINANSQGSGGAPPKYGLMDTPDNTIINDIIKTGGIWD